MMRFSTQHLASVFAEEGKYDNFRDIASNLIRKNAIYGFLPGSVFCRDGVQTSTVIGKIVDLKPDAVDMGIAHHVWRNGKSIMLPIILK